MATRQVLSIGLASVLSVASVAALPGGPAGAAGKTYYMCQNKKSGAVRVVPKGTKCKKKEKRIKGKLVSPQGSNGPQGFTGPLGPAGAPGPAGWFQAVDQNDRVIGQLVAFYLSTLPVVRMPSGVLLVWENTPGTTNPVNLPPSVVFYKEAACAGDAYAPYIPTFPFDLGIIPASPAVPGSPVYRLTPGTLQSINSQSYRDPTGCTDAPGVVSDAYLAKPAGTVPAVTPPLQYRPQP